MECELLPFTSPEHENLIDDIKSLLDDSYQPIPPQMGKREILKQLQDAETYLAMSGENLIGIVTLVYPTHSQTIDWYKKNGVAVFTHFAIQEKHRGKGIGSFMMETVEERAKELGAMELALDTAENAPHLIKLYESRGFRTVGYHQWPYTDYRSIVMSKSLL